MGFPSSGTEAMYRNNIDDVRKFFDMKHPDSYMVYNLCSEKSYDHEKFGNRVVRFPFDDHNVPHFDDLEPFCEALDEWLSSSSDAIAAIHCKNGMGRSGLVISTYLLHTGMCDKAQDALSLFGIARTTNQKGVTVPSQRRWVEYYEKLMSFRHRGMSLPKSKHYKVTHLFVSKSCPNFKSCIIYNNHMYEKKWELKKVKKIKTGYSLTIPEKCIIFKDVKVQFISGTIRKTRVFSFWFNTDFIEHDGNDLHLEKLSVLKQKTRKNTQHKQNVNNITLYNT